MVAIIAGLVGLLAVGFVVLRLTGISLPGGSDNDDPRTGVSPTAGPTEMAGGELSGVLNGSGSANGLLAMETWRTALQAAHPDLTLNFEPSGSGSGRDQFLAGGTDFALSDVALSDEELAGHRCAAPPIHLPLVVSPIAVMVNLPGVEELRLDAPTIAQIYQGGITQWNDPAIAALNPDLALPELLITPVYRTDDGQVNRVLSSWLTATGAWALEPDVTWPTTSGEGANGSSGVESAVQSVAGAIGYTRAVDVPDGLVMAQLKNGEDFFAADGPEATYQLDGSPRSGQGEHDQARDLDQTIGGAYPVIQVTYVIVCGQYASAEKGTLVKGVLSAIFSPVVYEQAAADGAAPLSEQMTTDIRASIESIS